MPLRTAHPGIAFPALLHRSDNLDQLAITTAQL